MTAMEVLRKFLLVIFAGGATISVGILAFFGMLAISPSLVLCIIAFVLAMAYEGQVNSLGINNSLIRSLDPHYLEIGIVEKYLDDLLAEEERLGLSLFPHTDNIFYKDYKAQKKYIQGLEKYIFDLEKVRNSLLPGSEAQRRDELKKQINQQKQELKSACERLRHLQLFFLKKLYHPVTDGSASKIEEAVAALIGDKATALKNEIIRKAIAIKISWLFSFAIGTCSGLATLSAMKAGIAAFSFLSFIPGGAIIALSAVAAIGYAKLIQANVAKMIQDYRSNWTGYFNKKENESSGMHILRCSVAVGAVVLALAATVATAGTWYKLVKDGAQIVGAVDKVASTLRDVFMGAMLLPSIIFNTQNTLESTDAMMKRDFKKQLTDVRDGIVRAWNTENFVRFCNPFRAIDKVITGITKEILFLGHSSSIGVSSGRIDIPFIPPVSPAIVATVGSVTEILTDKSYLPNETKRRKESPLLGILCIPLYMVSGVLKVFATMWDYTFSSPRDLKASAKKIFMPYVEENKPVPIAPVKPDLSEEWNRQELIETCNDTIDRLDKQNVLQKIINKQSITTEKIEITKKVKIAVASGNVLERNSLEQMTVPLSKHRNGFWYKLSKPPKPQSQSRMDKTINSYFSRQRVGA